MSLTIDQKIEVLNYHYPNENRRVTSSGIEWFSEIPEPTELEYETLYTALLLERTRTAKLAEILEWRNNKITNGVAYTFDGVEDVIQIRDQDKPNLLALALKARAFAMVGDDTTLMRFRAESNTTYHLTSSEMLSMTNYALAFAEDTYQISWDLKDAARAATTIAEIEAITVPIEE